MTITCIRNARWVVAWDATARQHYFRNDIDVAFDGNRHCPCRSGLCRPGRPPDRRQRTFCVMPGMVNVHTHLQSESIGRGLIEELGNPALYMTGILDEKSVFVTSGLTEQAGGAPAQLKANRASTQNAIAELLKSGCDDRRPTSPSPGTAGSTSWPTPASAPSRRRCIATRAGTVPTGHRLDYDWDLEKGRRDFADALATRRCGAEPIPSGRLGGMVAPMQVDTCSPELMRDSLAAARERASRSRCTARSTSRSSRRSCGGTA